MFLYVAVSELQDKAQQTPGRLGQAKFESTLLTYVLVVVLMVFILRQSIAHLLPIILPHKLEYDRGHKLTEKSLMLYVDTVFTPKTSFR